MASENSARNIAVWIIVGLIVAALAVGLSMPQLMPSQGPRGGQTLVSVHGHDLTSRDWNYQFRLLSSTLGGYNPKDEAQQKRVRAREIAIETLVERELAYNAATQAGLASVVEDAEELVKKGEILSAGSSYMWRRPEEPFNYDGFRRGFVPQFMVNERDYLEFQRRSNLARTFYDLVSATAVVSQPELRAFYESQADKLGLRTVTYDPASFEPLMDPTTAELSAYVKSHEKELEDQAKEKAQRYKGLAPQIDLSFLAIQKGDDATKAKKQAKTLAVTAKKKSTNFAQLARANSQDERTALKGGHYGFVDIKTAKESPESLDVDKAVLKAVASLKPGAVSGVVEGDKAYYIVRAGEKRQGDLAHDKVLQDLAMDAVKKEMAKKEAKKHAEALLSKLEAGTKLDKLLEDKDALNVVIGPFAKVSISPYSTPPFLRGNPPPTVQLPQEMIDKAWTQNEPKFLPQVYDNKGKWVVGEVQTRESPSDEGFAEKKDELKEQLLRQRADSMVADTLKERCQRALAAGEVAPNGIQLRQLFSYGKGQPPASYNVCEKLGGRGKDLRFAAMMQRFTQMSAAGAGAGSEG